jgi:hypothetical protein
MPLHCVCHPFGVFILFFENISIIIPPLRGSIYCLRMALRSCHSIKVIPYTDKEFYIIYYSHSNYEISNAEGVTLL